MKRRTLRFLAWVNCCWGAFLVSYGIGKLIVIKSHWLNGLWIVIGIVFIIMGVYLWKTSKIVY